MSKLWKGLLFCLAIEAIAALFVFLVYRSI